MSEQPSETAESKLPPAYEGKGPLHCSFCLKSQHEVQKLIAGPGFIFVCNECVALCDAIIAGTWDPSMVDASKFKIDQISTDTLLTRLKPIEQTLQGMGNQLQTVVEELAWPRGQPGRGSARRSAFSRQSAWERFSLKRASWPTWLGLGLALAGPGLVALASRHWEGGFATVTNSTPWLAVFAGLIAAVAALAVYGERLARRNSVSGALAGSPCHRRRRWRPFFIFVFGPAAYWVLMRLPLGSFGGGTAVLSALPTWFLVLDVVIVSAGEEWLYRGYAIERLQAMTGKPWLAGVISRWSSSRWPTPAALGARSRAFDPGLGRRADRALSVAARRAVPDAGPRRDRPLRAGARGAAPLKLLTTG